MLKWLHNVNFVMFYATSCCWDSNKWVTYFFYFFLIDRIKKQEVSKELSDDFQMHKLQVQE